MHFDRHDRVKSLLTELIASFVRDEANPDPLITVTNIEISPDYRSATAYITTIPEGREEDALAFLRRKAGEMRKQIKKKSDLKIVPFFTFELDRGERHRQHMDEIVRTIEEEKHSN